MVRVAWQQVRTPPRLEPIFLRPEIRGGIQAGRALDTDAPGNSSCANGSAHPLALPAWTSPIANTPGGCFRASRKSYAYFSYKLLFLGSSFALRYSSPSGPIAVICVTYSPDFAQWK